MSIESLIGKTITSIEGAETGSDEVIFQTSDGFKYKMYHWQDCCEHVCLNEVIGDVSDLIGHPVLEAEEATNQDDPPDGYGEESWTWTFYKIGTIKGFVTLRWLGTSNGYYSESVNFDLVGQEKPHD